MIVQSSVVCINLRLHHHKSMSPFCIPTLNAYIKGEQSCRQPTRSNTIAHCTQGRVGNPLHQTQLLTLNIVARTVKECAVGTHGHPIQLVVAAHEPTRVDWGCRRCSKRWKKPGSFKVHTNTSNCPKRWKKPGSFKVHTNTSNQMKKKRQLCLLVPSPGNSFNALCGYSYPHNPSPGNSFNALCG